MSGKIRFCVIFLPLFFLIFAPQAFARGLETIDSVAEAYVKLALDFGRYEGDYVDSYYGPKEWLPRDTADAIFPRSSFRTASLK